jgi:predicted 3-demethylubiquinone-9 3-methyltransferase (glyoxalase superfamily)
MRRTAPAQIDRHRELFGRGAGTDDFRVARSSEPVTGSPTHDRSGAMPKLTPNLWFDTQSEEAAEFYISVFPNSKVTSVTYYGEAGPGPAGTVLTVTFVLDGQEFTAINGGPMFSFDEAISFVINCADQEEIDFYWSKLIEGGGEESQCGWLKDKYGLSWQVVPTDWEDLLNDPDPARAQRAVTAMLGMRKIDIAAIQAAADQA